MITAAEALAITKNHTYDCYGMAHYFRGYPAKNKKLLKEIEDNIKNRAKHKYDNVEFTVTLDIEAYHDLCGYLRYTKGYDVTTTRRTGNIWVMDISWK